MSYGEIDHESALRVADALAGKKDIKKIELNGQSLSPVLILLHIYNCNSCVLLLE